MTIQCENNTLHVSYETSDWRNEEISFSEQKFFLPEFLEPKKADASKRFPMTINGKSADVILCDDKPMGAIRALLVEHGHTDIQQAHLYIMNREDFPELNGHMYLSYLVTFEGEKELLFLLIRKK
ncbi:hypothetical protein IPF86_00090 [Candidatus Nomurabacteria bacterium]|jgi:hypothetical protein|nr:MAG: hypothetical protein IPF86_00090 [Candidatus Nomurabacteria bacterium]